MVNPSNARLYSEWLRLLFRVSACMALAPAGMLGCAPQEEGPALDLVSAETNIRTNDTGAEEYNEMAQVLRLDPAAMDRLGAAFAERDEAVERWIAGEKGQLLIETEARMMAAVEARDLAMLKQCTATGKPLRDELRRLIEDHETAIMNTLTPEQQVHWQGYEVTRKMLELMQPLNLGFDQAQAIEGAGPAAVHQAIAAGEPTPKAAAFLALEQWAEESVLDEAQRAAYEAIKAENKLRSLGV